MTQTPRCKSLVLDAGPLLSLTPLRGLADTYLTVPQVLTELKDKRAREHFERLGLNSGVNVAVRNPSPVSLAHVIQFAKKTGDYSVLSHADICVIALTHTLDEEAKAQASAETKPENNLEKLGNQKHSELDQVSERLRESSIKDIPENSANSIAENACDDGVVLDPSTGCSLNVDLNDEPSSANNNPPSETPTAEAEPSTPSCPPETPLPEDSPLFDDPSDGDDGEGEWITPDNAHIHKSRALNLLPETTKKGSEGKRVDTGCMTADFAMQNVILQIGLNLVGFEGKRIEKVKSWVLRCHACFKICKDSSKKFCPSCGNPTLLRASVTISSPNASNDASVMQVHLKKNFQYRVRGTKYSIPSPKPGSAKGGPGTGLILREDQLEFMRAQKQAEVKREKEEARVAKGVFSRSGEGNLSGVAVGSWMDPDWVPGIVGVGSSGKGRSLRGSGFDGDLPVIGYGRKNPNERRRKK